MYNYAFVIPTLPLYRVTSSLQCGTNISKSENEVVGFPRHGHIFLYSHYMCISLRWKGGREGGREGVRE